MVVLSAPFNPSHTWYVFTIITTINRYPTISAYLTHPAVTKVRRSVKYKNAPNRWRGKKSPMYGLVVKRKCTTINTL